MSASSDAPATGERPSASTPGVRPAIVLQLLMLLAGAAVGLWPESVHPPELVYPSVLPLLRTVAAAEAMFIVLVYPLCVRAAILGGAGRRELLTLPAGLTLLLAPFLATGAWFGNGMPVDAVRTAGQLVALWPLGHVIGLHLARGPLPALAMGKMLGIALGLPTGWYVLAELVPSVPAGWLWRLAPATFAWETAGDLGRRFPRPVWAWLIWPAAALAAWLIRRALVRPGERRDGAPKSPTPDGPRSHSG